MFDYKPKRQPRLLEIEPLPLRDYIRARLEGFERRQKARDEKRKQANERNRLTIAATRKRRRVK
jgi:hypothetical protein